MPLPRPLSKEQILLAMEKTKSVKAAARFLNASYIHTKKYMKLYTDENGVTLFDLHKNQCGKGIPKFLSNGPKSVLKLDDILEGRIPIEHFTSDKVKRILIKEGYLKEVCTMCGFKERRVVDYKMPLILSFKDKNKRNFKIDNVELVCYNCYFLTVGNIFTNKDMRQLEEHINLNETTEAVNFQLDDWQIEQLKNLGLHDDKMDGEEYISRL
jgi:hypothetical protein